VFTEVEGKISLSRGKYPGTICDPYVDRFTDVGTETFGGEEFGGDKNSVSAAVDEDLTLDTREGRIE